VVPESVMPPYAFLAKRELDHRDAADKVRAMRALGVPYSRVMADEADADLTAQADPDASSRGLKARYGKALVVRDFDGDPDRITEMDALIAYLQMQGTLVDFSTYKAGAPANRR
jgi:cytochrome c oxidase cbb3-type subunit 2